MIRGIDACSPHGGTPTRGRFNQINFQDQESRRSDVDFAQRAAVYAVAPHLQNLEQQNSELRQRLAIEARHSLDQRVEQALPNYREIDRDPRWHRWLLSVDPLSGCTRQQLLNQAVASTDAG